MLSERIAMHARQHGHTLIDTAIALAIAAVLAGIAVPSFDGALRKARRADALIAVAQIQGAQERLRSRGGRYGTLDEIGVGSTSRSGHYTLQVTAFDGDGYTAVAIAAGPQSRDTACRYMSVRAAGADLSYASGADTAFANAAPANRQCWSL